MLNYLLLLLSLKTTRSQFPTVKVPIPAQPVVINSNGQSVGVSTITTNGEISIDSPAYFDPDQGLGKLKCPVVNINMVPNTSGMQIKPQYQTFLRDEPAMIEVFALDGVRFTEFFIQAKDIKTNTTVGHWRVNEKSQEAYR